MQQNVLGDDAGVHNARGRIGSDQAITQHHLQHVCLITTLFYKWDDCIKNVNERWCNYNIKFLMSTNYSCEPARNTHDIQYAQSRAANKMCTNEKTRRGTRMHKQECTTY